MQRITTLLLAGVAASTLVPLTCLAQDYVEPFESWPVGAFPPPWVYEGQLPQPAISTALNRTGAVSYPYAWPTPFAGMTGDRSLMKQIPPNSPAFSCRLAVPPPVADRFRADLSLAWSSQFRGLIEVRFIANTPTGQETVRLWSITPTGQPGAPSPTVSSALVAGQVVKSATYSLYPDDWNDLMAEHGPVARECVHTGSQTIWYTSLATPSTFARIEVRVTPAPGSPGGLLAIDDVCVIVKPPVCLGDVTHGALPGSIGYGNPNGILSNDDFFYFLSQFAAGNLQVCDLTSTALVGAPGYGIANNILNGDDFFFYLSFFAEGC